MRILLVAPSQPNVYGSFSTPAYPPLGLAYLGAILEKSNNIVRIIDMDADKISEHSFIKTLKKEDFDLVGITTTTPTFNKAVYLSKLIKDNSNAFTVLGGIHATVMPEESMRFDTIDFIVKGEGEKTILELVDYLEGHSKLESVDGIYYRNNGRIIKNKDRELIPNLDELPFPARHLFNQQSYTYPDTLYRRTFPIITSRGCPANCSYCNSKNMFYRKFRARSSKNVVDEIEYLMKNFQAREIHVWDDNFTLRRERVFQIRDEIKRRSIKTKFAFPNGLRVDCVDGEVLRVLKDMGTYSVAFGVESGNQRVLDKANKNIRLEQIEHVFRLTKKIGLEAWAFFMIGLLTEEEDSIKDTIDFAIKLNPDIVKFHILKPFPGSDIYKEFMEQGLLLDNDFDHFGIHTPPVHSLKNLNPNDLLKWHRKAYRRFYLRPSVIIRQLFRLKSFNRVRLNLSAAMGVLKIMLREKHV